MKKMFALATISTLTVTLALADLTGNGSGASGGPGDPYLFGNSGFDNDNVDLVTLVVKDTLGNSYSFTTSYDEINAGYYNQGWWSTDITNENVNPNFIVGNSIDATGDIFNDFFTFNMGQNTLVAPIASATLSIQTTSSDTDGLPLTYYVGSVSIDAATLNDKVNGPDTSIVNALSSGTSYGQIAVNSTSDYTDPLNITLDAAAITALTGVANTTDFFSIGGTVSPTATTATPEPFSLALLSTVAGLLFLLRRKVWL